ISIWFKPYLSSTENKVLDFTSFTFSFTCVASNVYFSLVYHLDSGTASVNTEGLKLRNLKEFRNVSIFVTKTSMSIYDNFLLLASDTMSSTNLGFTIDEFKISSYIV